MFWNISDEPAIRTFREEKAGGAICYKIGSNQSLCSYFTPHICFEPAGFCEAAV